MYGLRSINNMYSEHAGSRSDFLIMGDPQFQFGKVHSCTKGYHASWDARPVPAHPRKNMARARSTGDLVKQLYAPGPIGLLKERALQRSMTKFDVPPLSPRGSGALVNSFAAFQDALLADGEAQRPKFGEQGLRTAASVAASKGHAPTCRHFSSIHKDIAELKDKMKANPQKTKDSLLATGAWKYYAIHLEQDRQMATQMRHDRNVLEPIVTHFHTTPGGAVSKKTKA
ncbi:unnamed protein product [Polarella glacialis]|uniref:Uncharacterized protein n=1 Tax=Polarella glacialis TaxID=89957 RepID=A0A813DYX4_POLGL|nr:unnamed protein product [Polarella glacialis]|mmetsp:Transcript_16293/g.26042  ORF Transcript_16293/g.26042 Transcript_16293/m.26042 type:complete len:228 (+) Transcript_16293:76-759(+)